MTNDPWISRRRLLCGALLGLAFGLAGAQPLPTAKPEEVGLSSAGLAKVGDWMRDEVAAKKIPGAVLMVVRGGKLAFAEVVGQRDPSTGTPLKADDIFRIYSMTKPLTSVAAMMLVEEGKLELDAPVAKYIPAFAKTRVGVEKADASGAKTLDVVDAVRPMTVRDLLRHTSGLTYGFFGTGLVKQAYRNADISADGDISNALFADTIAAMPLAFQPGSTWDYSNSTDVLGRVVEIASGQSLGAFLKARLFEPLGMKDTSFYVTDPARQARLAEPFAGDVITPGKPLFDPRAPKAMESGGGGLVSTAADYTRFLLMLRNGGQLDGKRYIAEATLKDMTRDQLGAQVTRTPLYLPGAGYGFGLGFAVRTANAPATEPRNSAVGEYYWGGAAGTYMWVDPGNDLFVVYMMQSPKQRVPHRAALRNLVYAALTEGAKVAGATR